MDDNKVAVLIENLMSQFRTFGDGLQGLRDDMSIVKADIETIKDDLGDLKVTNRIEHQQITQMIQELNHDQREMKQKIDELDQEFEIKLKRIK